MTQPVRKIDQRRHVSNKAMQGILEAAAQYPLPIDVVLAAVGLNAKALNDIDGRISHRQACDIWQELVSRSGDPYLGLSLIQFSKPETYDVLGYISNSCENLGEALVKASQYFKIIHSGEDLTLEINEQTAQVTHRLAEPLAPKPAAFNQWIIASIVLFLQKATGVEWKPLQVGFEHPKPKNLEPYHRFFCCPIEFDRPTNEVIFNIDLLKLPLLNADNKLCELLEQHAKERLAKLPQSENFLDNVRQIIYKNLTVGNFSLNEISKQMGYTPRTLQRKFKEAGLSYQTLLDEIRQELSYCYLREGQISTSEIGFLLGFSEASAFHRAFRRWTGKTPGEYRRKTSV